MKDLRPAAKVGLLNSGMVIAEKVKAFFEGEHKNHLHWSCLCDVTLLFNVLQMILSFN